MDKRKVIKPLTGHATVDRVKNLVGKFETIRPAYTSILGLFGPIFLAQERARESVVVHPGKVTRVRLESFKQQESTLIDKSAFIIDMASAKLLFGDICTIAVHSDAEEMRPETALMQAMTAEDFDPNPLFLAVINEDEDLFHATALAYQTTPQALMLLAYNSIKPSLESCASVLKNYLYEDMFWQKPGCPVCGSPPILSVLDAGGKRILICGFCWSEWTVPRIRCSFCLETDSRKLHYQTCDQEREYRIDVCDRCRSYLKTVDTRKLDRPFYAPLESLVSAHLDLHMKNYHAA
jgi:FdhE protein